MPEEASNPSVSESCSEAGIVRDLKLWELIGLGLVGGAALGAVGGAAFAYFSRRFEDFPASVMIGAVVGLLPGCVFLLIRARPTRGLSAFSLLGLVGGLIPGSQWLPGPSQHAGSAMAFLCPIAGVLLGAFFDRTVDELSKSRTYVGITALALGIGVTMGCVWLLDKLSYGKDPTVVVREIKSTIRQQLNEDFGPDRWKVKEVTLERIGRTSYEGSVLAVSSDLAATFQLSAVSDNCSEIVWFMRYVADDEQ